MDWIVFRVAELYLNYAEALNEYYETPPKEAFDAVLKVRERSGMPGFPSTLNKEQFTNLLIDLHKVDGNTAVFHRNC